MSTGDTVNICSIKRRDPAEAKVKDLPEHFVEITHKFTVKDQWVCGVAPMKQVITNRFLYFQISTLVFDTLINVGILFIREFVFFDSTLSIF
jgi:hypothetical protein